MINYVLRRLLISIPLVIAAITVTFLLVRLMPGSPFASEKNLDPAIEAQLEKKYGLDGTLGEQVFRYWQNLMQGDLGPSTQYRNRTVSGILASTFPVSATLGILSIMLALLVGTVGGTIAAIYHNRWEDRGTMLLVLVGICMPSFILGPMLALFFSLLLGWLPIAGWGSPSQLILPVLALGLPYGAYCARLVRTSMLEVLDQDFIRTARAKGLRESAIHIKHALKVGILPLVSYSGPLAANVLTGSIVVEEIFTIPGMGPFFVGSVFNADAFLLAGCVAIYSTLLVLFNLIVDVLFAYLDRRVSLS
jgi:oligopeptide transport system permease protein